MLSKNKQNDQNVSNIRLFNPPEKEASSSPAVIQPTLQPSDNILKIAPDIQVTDCEENKDKLIMKPVYQNINQVDLWENVDRQTDNKDDVTKYTVRKKPTNTLKKALKNRPPVAEFILKITKANKEDIEKRKQRERDKWYHGDAKANTGEKRSSGNISGNTRSKPGQLTKTPSNK